MIFNDVIINVVPKTGKMAKTLGYCKSSEKNKIATKINIIPNIDKKLSHFLYLIFLLNVTKEIIDPNNSSHNLPNGK